jgi:hypothetical protein
MANNNDKDQYSIKPPYFNGEKFEYWKDRIESFFLGYDADLSDAIIHVYTPHVDAYGVNVNICLDRNIVVLMIDKRSLRTKRMQKAEKRIKL